MKRKWIFFLVIVLMITLGLVKLIYHQFKVNIYDSYENPLLNRKIWSTERMEPSSFEIQSNIVCKGKSAIKITLKYGDKVEHNNKDKDTERDELLESRKLFAVEDIKYDYQFNMFIPDSFPIIPVRLVIAQWKQDCPFCSCTNYSPILALRYIAGRFFITLQTDSVRHELYTTNEDIRGHWLDFRFLVKFSKKNDGEVKAYLDNKEIVNYRGITSYADDCRFLSTKNKYYFKMGLYRDRIIEPMVIYIDEYKKRRLD